MLLRVVNCEKVNICEKRMEGTGYIVRYVCADPSQCQLPVSSDNGYSLLCMGKTAFSQKGGTREFSLHLLFPSCLQLKITLLPKCHIL